MNDAFVEDAVKVERTVVLDVSFSPCRRERLPNHRVFAEISEDAEAITVFLGCELMDVHLNVDLETAKLLRKELDEQIKELELMLE